ncbi:UvrD-helicase domain-containing protein [Candidatus Babeliales bacterium]|nr:UvrD-helicase domain-containing protein [Candidatus Babeliales bacterium]
MNPIADSIIQSLNSQQKKAVLHENGGLLVVSGAGSGKTRVITSRIAYLLTHHQVHPDSIIALTFTNKAAREMKERIVSLVGESTKIPFIGTFHGYCLLLLRRFKQLTEMETFSILDQDDQQQLLKRIIKKFGCDKQVTASSIQSFISQQKNGSNSDSAMYLPPIFKELQNAYEEEKVRSHALDFDDLMIKVLHGFKKHPDFKAGFQERIKHILVDEYQDTNKVQHELLQQMSCNQDKTLSADSICAVGDEDQSIYSWRGANVSNMQDFKEDFAPVTVIKIEQNYRSVQPILQAANDVILNNKNRIPKELWSDKKATNRVLAIHCQSGYQEADIIARYIATLPESIKKSDVAILYRTHYQSRNIEEALIKNSIPYHIVGGLRFYERKEIKDILAYLRLVVNPYDRVSFLRIFNTPTRGLGAKVESMILERWEQEPFFDFKSILKTFLEGSNALSGIRAESIREFIDLFDGLSTDHEPSYVADSIMQNIGYRDYIKNHYDTDEARTKLENCKEFINSMMHSEKKTIISTGEPLSLQTFLHEVALLQEKIEEDKTKVESIHIMTLHAVKGLEFNTVFIMGLEEGLIPSSRSLNSAAAIEEERRLLYVGMTRAKERLIISYAQQRMSFGQINDQEPSRFIKEIPAKHSTTLHLYADPLFLCEQRLAAWRSGNMNVTFQTARSDIRLYGSRKTNSAQTKSFVSKVIKTNLPWNKNELVKHNTFGQGIIKQVEKTNDELYLLTIIFTQGQKKILSSFIQKI